MMDTVRWVVAGLGAMAGLGAVGYVLGVKLDRKVRKYRKRGKRR